MEIYKKDFFVEMYTKHEGHLHGFKQVLVTVQTAFQQLAIVDTHEYGRCLLLDGMMQSSEKDEFLYHEMLVHPALCTHRLPRNVLIVGGGEGATLREVLKHPVVESCDMIEIDGEVLNFAKTHLQQWHQGAFDDPRVRLIVADGRRHLEQHDKRYDVIILDISDPGDEGPAYLLYTQQFYRLVRRRLNPGGIVAVQAGTSSIVDGRIMASIYHTLATVFAQVHGFEVAIPSFDMPWGILMASDEADPMKASAAHINERLGELREVLKAYDGETHAGLFHMTKALRTMLAMQGRVILDDHPLFTPL